MSRMRQTAQQTKGKQLPKDYMPKSAGSSMDKKASPKKSK